VNKSKIFAEESRLAEEVKKNPTSVSSLQERGVLFFQNGEYEKAIDDYTQAIKLVGESAPLEAKGFNRDPLSVLYRKRGEAYAAKGENDKALADFGEAVKCARDDAAAYNSRGIVYKDIGKYGKAIADFKQVIRLEPGNTTARSNLDVAITRKREFLWKIWGWFIAVVSFLGSVASIIGLFK
jgi:tetratricopeptide (TPR) repeat protein